MAADILPCRHLSSGPNGMSTMTGRHQQHEHGAEIRRPDRDLPRLKASAKSGYEGAEEDHRGGTR